MVALSSITLRIVGAPTSTAYFKTSFFTLWFSARISSQRILLIFIKEKLMVEEKKVRGDKQNET